jgi:DNA-damage-inducible protein J
MNTSVIQGGRMSTSTLITRVNAKDKECFLKMCEELGVSASTALNMFVKKCIRDGSILGIELEIRDENGFTTQDVKYLLESIDQLKNGDVIEYKMDVRE